MNARAGHDSLPLFKPKWSTAVVVLLAVTACLFVSPLSGILPNVGLPFGYYGKLNRVKARLRSLPNVEILGVRGNYDVTLEDFTLDLRIDGRHVASLYFREAPTTPTWELFDKADSLVVGCPRKNSSDTWKDARSVFDLGPDNDLEEALGYDVRNGHDALKNFGRIMKLIQTTPPTTLGEPALGKVIYMSIPRANE